MPSFRLRVRTTELDLPVGELTVGRGTDCFLRIDDDLVSRRHARLLVSDAQVQFEDLGSRNGSKVNGVRTTGAVPLRIGDTFEIGSQVFQLITTGAVPRDATMTMMPHQPCRVCDLLIDSRTDLCPHCGASQSAAEPASPRQRREPTAPQVTDPGDDGSEARRSFLASLMLVTGVADKLLALGRVDEAEKVLGPRLREVLSRRQAGEVFDGRVCDEALVRAARLATGTGRDEWYQWIFAFARLTGRRFEDRVIDDLHARMLVHKPAASEQLTAYLRAQDADAPEAAQYRLRLEALLRFCR